MHMMPSPRPIAPSCSARLPFTDTGASTASLNVCCIAARAGANFGRSHTTAQSMLATVHPSSASRETTWRNMTIESAPAHRVGVGEVFADVTEAGRPEQGIGAGVGDHVGVAVSDQPTLALERDAAEDEAAIGIVGEAVDVEALTDADVATGRSSVVAVG